MVYSDIAKISAVIRKVWRILYYGSWWTSTVIIINFAVHKVFPLRDSDRFDQIKPHLTAFWKSENCWQQTIQHRPHRPANTNYGADWNLLFGVVNEMHSFPSALCSGYVRQRLTPQTLVNSSSHSDRKAPSISLSRSTAHQLLHWWDAHLKVCEQWGGFQWINVINCIWNQNICIRRETEPLLENLSITNLNPWNLEILRVRIIAHCCLFKAAGRRLYCASLTAIWTKFPRNPLARGPTNALKPTTFPVDCDFQNSRSFLFGRFKSSFFRKVAIAPRSSAPTSAHFWIYRFVLKPTVGTRWDFPVSV